MKGQNHPIDDHHQQLHPDEGEESPRIENRPFFQSPMLGKIQFGNNQPSEDKSTPDLYFKEAGEGTKSLMTVGEFGEEEKTTTFGASPDIGLTKKLHTKSGSDYFRDKLIEDLNNLIPGEGHHHPNEEKSQDKHSQDKLKESQNSAVGHSAAKTDKSQMQKTLEITQIYQNELSRVMEDQASKWNEMISQLNNLPTNDLNGQLLNFVNNLKK